MNDLIGGIIMTKLYKILRFNSHKKDSSNSINRVLCSIAFIVLVLVCIFAILAQEPFIIELKKGEQPAENGKVIIYSDGDAITVDDSNVLKGAAGSITINAKKGSGNSQQKQNLKERRSQQNIETGDHEEKLSSEERQIMKDLKKDLKETKKSESKEIFQEKMASQSGSVEKIGNPNPGSSGGPKEIKDTKGANPSEAGLKRYLDAVVNKNLFLPLGSGAEEKKSSYVVTALMSDPTNRADDKAIIEEIGSRKGYYVSEGDKFAGNVEVMEVNEGTVKLNRSGEEMTLRLGEGTNKGAWGGGGGGSRGEKTGGGENRPEGAKMAEGQNRSGGGGQDNFDPSQIPPFALEIMKQRGISIEDLKNSPDLREKLRGEIMDQIKRGGGPPMGNQGGRGRGQDR
jgi:hypothetical protein